MTILKELQEKLIGHAAQPSGGAAAAGVAQHYWTEVLDGVALCESVRSSSRC